MAVRYDLRDSARRRDQINLMRLETLVPALMSEHEIDCWVVTSREYADDSVAMTMLPAGWFSSRRRSILVFLRDGSEVERISVARYATDGLFEVKWDPASQPDQWEALADLLRDRSPQKIAINLSHDFAHGDGLTHGEFLLLEQALGDEMARRLVPADQLSVNWLETRIPEERKTMRTACREAHQILRRALSVEAIEPGVTTTDDVGWWLRREVQQLGTHVWFHPTVSLQREGDHLRDSFVSHPGSRTIQPGDLVHIDFGIVWDGLCTDQQQQGFVLGPDCPEVPGWVESALNTGNQLQDLLTAQFQLGRSGNEILASTLQAAEASGIDGVIYTHPIGFHGHGAGPPIGLWDNQTGIPGAGDRTLRAGTAWSIELMAKVRSEGWNGQTVSIMLEEDAWFDGEVVEYLDGRQTEIWAIG
ncbi:MAG: M24 family peptidase [Acidimicrobiia bacterium]